MLKSLFLGDILNDLTHAIRPFEVDPGATDRVMDQCLRDLAAHLRDYKADELSGRFPSWLPISILGKNGLRSTLTTIYKIRRHLRGEEFTAVLHRCRERINTIAMDRTRVKPIVKIIGEFWAQTTEGDGNYRMFDFLEREGAHVQPESISTWITYLLNNAQLQMEPRRGLDEAYEEPDPLDIAQRLTNEWQYRKRRSLLAFGEWLYTRQYHQVANLLGGTAHRLVPQHELSRLADPYYRTLARGGEGYLEVGKNIYYTANRLCHMVLSLKPFGCMPSSQSDGVQSAVVSKFSDMIFLPIETSGEGEVNAHSRVQMALGEARAKAKAEFQHALKETGRSIEEIRDCVARHPELRRPFYPVPHRAGVAGVAANFVFHISDVMAGRAVLQSV
jgi:predicted nucleotide-binding protein (sugar kinase/HSP70/actin superfamily)